MKVVIELLSDAIFGSGASIPGAEDMSIQCDRQGFPYYRGTTFKGIMREEYENYLFLCGIDASEADRLFGKSGDNDNLDGRLIFSDFELPYAVKRAVMEELGDTNPMDVTEAFSHIRTFTRIDEEGTVADGSLRNARCIDKGLRFYGTIEGMDNSDDVARERLNEVLGMVKSIGTMRNRGFGQVRVREVEG